ncbi:MAG: aldehyde dehydrogenase (NADP(+)) [Myxococcota bacterium]|nr:aldehyde dehydrogenase (NADP(+)) [Myxococcota bacterium]
MELHGRQIIGHGFSAQGPTENFAVNPATGERLKGAFHSATVDEIQMAAEAAIRAFEVLRTISAQQRADFLDCIAQEIEAIQQDLVDRCHEETGLPQARLVSEVGRTTHQLRMFADLVRDGSWVDARIDGAIPDRHPVPRPDVRRMLMPLGPTVVFCASNFPLAFSTAGVDTASALAAGNPVIVKGHSAHPGTAELVGGACMRASERAGMPSGTFSLLHGPGSQVGMSLVKHPLVRAVGFTGSQAGGRTLFDAAASRPVPIPVYAEMASINPVFILPGALEKRGNDITAGLCQSVTLGVGQFCTNPGILVLLDSPDTEAFIRKAATLLAETPVSVMLNKGIRQAYAAGIERLTQTAHVTRHVHADPDAGPGACHASATLFQTRASHFLDNPDLKHEVFGPSTLAVICSEDEELLGVARSFTGELSATIHADQADLSRFALLRGILEARVGRLVFNGFPTGVEVCSAMNHGGPYPATTDVHFTSVGTASIFRFARPICYQNCPQDQLPDELKDANPRRIWRTVNGTFNNE